ncbi:MAG: hypothetical protein M1556_04595 [Candidatus Thermoplasmatota archaeon]|nr:hypothetical protein [Candidatus Thermoplasmatota archaeon]MCL6002905.1 hypothetical protein [Candidatus Thermoplasmatota archaeon]
MGTFKNKLEIPVFIILLLFMLSFLFATVSSDSVTINDPLSSTSSSIQMQGATVETFHTALQLPSGSQLYLYGLSTGGGYPTSIFASGEYASSTDSAGNLVAAIAVTTDDSNSYSTSTSYQTIGGVGITGFSSYTTSFGVNNASGATFASDTFSVNGPGDLVVIVAIPGGETYMNLTGVPGLQIDASSANTPGQSPLAIAHSYLDSGEYTVTMSTQYNPSQTQSNMGDLIGVFVFSPGGTVNDQSPSSPTYAFDGAYANYDMSFTYAGYTESIPIDFSVTNVNTANQSFTINETYGGSYSMLSGIYQATFANPAPFPAVSSSDLKTLDQGNIPPDYSGGTVLTHQSINVPAGTFTTDEITYNGVTMWVDSTTGLLVKESGASFSFFTGDLELQSTNVKGTNSSTLSLLYIIIPIVVVVVIVLAVVLLIARRRRTKPVVSPPEKVHREPNKEKLTQLQKMKDDGLITQSDFEEQSRILKKGGD